MTTKTKQSPVPALVSLADDYAEARAKNGSHLYNRVTDEARQAMLDALPVAARSPDLVEALAHRSAWRYAKSSDPAHSDTYTFNRHTLLDFAYRLMQPVAAPEGQDEQPGIRVQKLVLDVDVLAQEIRRIDGKHEMGAGALAEALLPFLSRQVGVVLPA